MSSSPTPVDSSLDLERAALEAECAVFARHLAGLEPSPYVVAQYLRAHEPGRNGPNTSTDDEDDPLLLFARRGATSARLADVWAATFDRTGPLRRKLILLLAILESGRDSEVVDRVSPGDLGAFVRGTLVGLVSFALTLVAAAVVIGPRALVWGRRTSGAAAS